MCLSSFSGLSKRIRQVLLPTYDLFTKSPAPSKRRIRSGITLQILVRNCIFDYGEHKSMRDLESRSEA